LLFLHGWPGSFLEVEPLIDSLTNPPNTSLPAFHVVAPSLPGYGFSPSPLKAGMGAKVIGAAFNALMTEKLGYARYVLQGGDFGAIIARVMAVEHPGSVAALHSYFWVMNPAPSDLERYIAGAATAEERAFIETNQRFNHDLWPTFGTLSALRPRKLSAALADSPVGLAVWIYDLLRPVTWGEADRVWTPERIVTWAMMQWIPGVYATLAIAEYFAQVCDKRCVVNGNTKQKDVCYFLTRINYLLMIIGELAVHRGLRRLPLCDAARRHFRVPAGHLVRAAAGLGAEAGQCADAQGTRSRGALPDAGRP
jgi:pimeloyl-ACP methyl ester carboxylesterase